MARKILAVIGGNELTRLSLPYFYKLRPFRQQLLYHHHHHWFVPTCQMLEVASYNTKTVDGKTYDNRIFGTTPYAASKLYGEFLCEYYHRIYGLDIIITIAFNHELPGRGHNFVTSDIIRQGVMCVLCETKRVVVGNLNARRDWSCSRCSVISVIGLH
jgi:hypothetical protein